MERQSVNKDDSAHQVFSTVTVQIDADFVKKFPSFVDFGELLTILCTDTGVFVIPSYTASFILQGLWLPITKLRNLLETYLVEYSKSIPGNVLFVPKNIETGSTQSPPRINETKKDTVGSEIVIKRSKKKGNKCLNVQMNEHKKDDRQKLKLFYTSKENIGASETKEDDKAETSQVCNTNSLDLKVTDGKAVKHTKGKKIKSKHKKVLKSKIKCIEPKETNISIKSKEDYDNHTMNREVHKKKQDLDIPEGSQLVHHEEETNDSISDEHESKDFDDHRENLVDESSKKWKKKRGRTIVADVKHQYECKKCDFVSEKRNSLNDHIHRTHLAKPTICDLCGKVFPNKRYMKRHRALHQDPQHCCDVCGKIYKVRKAWMEHMKSHNSGYTKPEFPCCHCQKSFTSKFILDSHIKSEHFGQKKSFLCQICGKSFTTKSTLNQHENVHSGERPYHCDVCDKSFSYESALRDHKFLHDKNPSFECGVCSKSFRQRSALKMHERIHKNEKKHACKTCGREFVQKQSMQRHERSHKGVKPFYCKICGRAFGDSSIIRRHIILIHKIEKDPKTWREDIIEHSIDDETTPDGTSVHTDSLTSPEQESAYTSTQDLQPTQQETDHYLANDSGHGNTEVHNIERNIQDYGSRPVDIQNHVTLPPSHSLHNEPHLLDGTLVQAHHSELDSDMTYTNSHNDHATVSHNREISDNHSEGTDVHGTLNHDQSMSGVASQGHTNITRFNNATLPTATPTDHHLLMYNLEELNVPPPSTLPTIPESLNDPHRYNYALPPMTANILPSLASLTYPGTSAPENCSQDNPGKPENVLHKRDPEPFTENMSISSLYAYYTNLASQYMTASHSVSPYPHHANYLLPPQSPPQYAPHSDNHHDSQ